MTRIMSQKNAQHVAADKPVLMMNIPNNENDAVLKIKEIASDCLYLIFWDIPAPVPGYIHPAYKHVRQALEWAEDKDLDDVICVCQAGVSRSSAMAFILNCAVHGPKKSLEVLNPEKHMPNPRIVALGADILGNHPVDFDDDDAEPLSLGVYKDLIRHPEKVRESSTIAREIMATYLWYVREVEAMTASEVPLEIIL